MQIVERCDTAVGLFIARDPSAPDLRAVEIKAGADIADLIAHAVNIGALEPDDLPELRVYVDGVAVPFASYEERADSLDIVPPPGSEVNLQVEPAGGSNGTARTVLTVVLTAVAVVSAFTVGAFTASLWQLGAAIIPQLVFPIQTPDRLAGPNDQGGLNSASNTIRRRGQMPLMLGSGRVTLDVAAQAYSVNAGGETWLHVIFAGHYGPCDMAEVKIGETLLSDYPASDIQVEYKLTPGPRAFSFYNQSVNQENLQDELDLGGAAEVHTTAEQCERVEIDLTWPQGLQFRKTNGSILQQETRVKVEWAPVGSESYTAAPLEGGPFMDRLGHALPTGTIDVIARTQDPVRRTLAWDKANADQIKIRISAWDPDNDDPAMATQAVYWTALRSIVKKQPVVDQNLACMALRIKSSDDLGGTLPTVTAVVTPHAPVYDPETQTWDDEIANWAPSDNPVAHVRMMLLGPGAAKPADPGEWGASFGEAYELVEARGWKGGYLLSTEASQKDALKILGAMGRFSAYDAGEGLVLVPDWEKAAPRQLFTGRNVQQFTYTRDFKQPCHAVVVEFLNIDEDGKPDEVTVYNTGYTAETATLLETIRFDWQMTGERATKEGFVFLAKRNVQVEAFEWTAGPSAIASSYGSRVLVRHYTSLYGAGEGRVLFRHMAGGLVAGVRLDDEVEMEAGQDYALDAQRYDKLLAGINVVTAPGRTRDLMFPSPLPVEDAPLAGDLVAFGKVDVVTEDVEIIDFAPSGDQVRISARKYVGPLLVAAETGEIPEFTTRLTASVKAPKPRLLGVTQATPDGIKIAFDITEVRGGLVEGFPVRWRRSSDGTEDNPWQTAATVAANGRLAQTPPFPEAVSAGKDPDAVYRVDVEVRTKLRSGDLSPALLVPNILITRGVADPTGFVAYGVAREGADGSKYPVMFVAVDALTSGLEQDLIVEVRPTGATDDDWFSAGKSLPSTNPRGDFPGQAPGAVLDVRVQWRTADNYTSNWLVETGVTIPLGSLVASGAQNLGDVTAEEVAVALENLRAAQLEIERVRAEAQVKIDKLLERLIQGIDGKPLAPVLKEHRETIAATLVEVGENKAAIEFEILARETAISSEAFARLALAANFDTFSAATTLELSTLATDQDATAALLATVSTDYDGFKASAQSTLLAHSSSIESLSTSQTSLASTVSSNKAAADASILTLTNTTSALSSSLTSLTTTVNSNKSSADSSIAALTTQQSATATSLTNLTTSYNGYTSTTNATLTSLSNTQSTQAGQITTLQSNAAGLSATVSANALTLVDVQNKVAAGRMVLEAAASGGRPARFSLYSDSYGASNVALSAASLYFGDNTVFDDATDTLRTVTGSTATVMAWGAPFGSSADLLWWVGPSSVALGSMSRANAYFYIAGSTPYMGGTGLGAGNEVKNAGGTFSGYIGSGIGWNTALNISLDIAAGPGSFMVSVNGRALRDGVASANAMGAWRLTYGGTTLASGNVTAFLSDGLDGTAFSVLRKVATSLTGSITLALEFQGAGPAGTDTGTVTGDVFVQYVKD